MKQLAVTEEAYLAGLVERVQHGDNDAFAELYTLTYKRLYAFASRFLQDERLAQDALQETYIVVYQSVGTLRDPKFFMTWLRSITQRICYDMCQRRRKQPSDIDAALLEILPDKTQEPLRSSERHDLRDLIDRLPLKEREAIILKYYTGNDLKEIAQAMGCSVSSVTRYLQRGYEKIRTGYWEGGEAGHAGKSKRKA